DREVRLWQDAAEKRKRGVGDDVEQRAEDHRSQEDLAPELPLLVSLPVADYVTCCGSRHPDHRHDVVLAVENDPEHGDGKSREHECSRFDRLLYGRWLEPQPAAQGSGHSVPTRLIDMSVSMTASPTTQPRRFLDLSTASNNSGFEAAVMTTTSIPPPAGAVPAEGSFGYLASHSSCVQRSRGDPDGSSPGAHRTTRPPSRMQSHASEAAIRAIWSAVSSDGGTGSR